ncbi:MAG: GH36-type glycosyl hydrolase domain-containing protein [Anaerolineaceae bacterium]
MKFGYFNAEHKEYVITDPKTPVKWINYIGTRAFGGFVDHTGGALICRNDPALNRITKYIQQMPSSDFKGETLYLRIENGDKTVIFSPFFVPTLHELDSFECHVGLGYTTIISQVYGIHTEVTIFVPENEHCEIRDIHIQNVSGEPLDIDVIPVLEYTHPDALGQYTNADWIPQTMQSKALQEEDGCTILLQYPFMLRDTRINYFTSNHPVSSFETDRKKFLGDDEYGSFKDPLSLHQNALSNSEAQRGDNMAALLHTLGTVQPGEIKQIITVLGQAKSIADARPVIRKYKNPAAVQVALKELSKFWDGFLESFKVKSPDADLDVMINLYNPRQCYTTFTWSRYLSYYQLGLGARGIGIRDSSQDTLAILAAVPEEARPFLKHLLSFQKIDGSAMHQFNPLTNIGNCGDSLEMEDRYHFYSDDHLWLVLGITAYINETGNVDILDEMIPYYDKDRDEKPIGTGSVMEHIERAFNFSRNNTGSHGLPLLGFADWNDTVNLPKGAESFFSANLYDLALKELIPILKAIGSSDRVEEYQQMYQEMGKRVEQYGWDGKWYLRYFDHQGEPVGSVQNDYCKIYLNGQSWPVLSGFASQERSQLAMDSVYEKLFTPNGIKLSTPSFNGYDPIYGGITTYPPGVKENGGIFVHPNPWAVIAETMLGNGDRAYQYYSATNPAARNDRIEIYECEPYVYSQNIISDEHPQFGLARNSWLTGAAAWHYIAATQYILGIRPELEGLRIDPCIPSTWDGFKVTRKFRGKFIHIEVHNPDHVCKGVRLIKIDDLEVKQNFIEMEMVQQNSIVEVWLGRN